VDLTQLKVETWPIERCIAYARNPRKNDEQVDRMASAIKEFGFRIPIVARSDGEVVDGHLRLKAAQKLGLKEVPVALADEPGKHKYLMPLDRKMRKQIAPLAKPYPKKTEQGGQHGKSEDATPAQHTRP